MRQIEFNQINESIDLDLTDVVRVLDENIPKYRQVNYESMREIINERKAVGSQALERGENVVVPMNLCFMTK